jgi:rod shape-determining protein MreC
MVTLDKGTDNGIALGDVVIVQGGALAGRVTDVGPTFAKVTLISDGTSTVVGQLQGSGKTGEIVGQAGGVLVMRNIDSTVSIGTDEEVFTPGIEITGGIRSPYPKGLVIGSVVDVERDANDVVQTAFLAPAANLDSFEVALVITDYDGGLPPVDEQAVPCGTRGTVPEGEVPCYTPTPKPDGPKATPKR